MARSEEAEADFAKGLVDSEQADFKEAIGQAIEEARSKPMQTVEALEAIEADFGTAIASFVYSEANLPMRKAVVAQFLLALLMSTEQRAAIDLGTTTTASLDLLVVE